MKIKLSNLLLRILFGFKSIPSRKDSAFILLIVIAVVLLLSTLCIRQMSVSESQSKRLVLSSEDLLKGSDSTSTSSFSALVGDSVEESEVWWFDIAGAVNKPGVYPYAHRLNEEVRVFQLIELAGGLGSTVSQKYVSKQLNMTALVKDGEKLYIPFDFEDMAVPVQVESAIAGSKSSSQVISVNTSSQKDLEMMAGVGAVRALKIIENRPYESLEELIIKKALTQKIIDDNQTIISL